MSYIIKWEEGLLSLFSSSLFYYLPGSRIGSRDLNFLFHTQKHLQFFTPDLSLGRVSFSIFRDISLRSFIFYDVLPFYVVFIIFVKTEVKYRVSTRV